MARFVYRLEPLLDQKKALKKDAETAFGERQKELLAAQDRMNELMECEKKAQQQKKDFRGNLLNGGGEGRAITNRVDRLRFLEQLEADAKNDVFSQRLAIEECEQRLAEARQVMTERSREVEVLSKHREQSEQEFWSEINRKEALEQDEIGATLYEARRRRTQL
jgi:flagellar biosynthesis chaperone FliJ